jgi:hypothetical protein
MAIDPAFADTMRYCGRRWLTRSNCYEMSNSVRSTGIGA